MKPEDQRVMLTKKLLKDSFVKLLMDKNIFKITVRELCDTAGINRSTFYKYYENQFSLLTEMEGEIITKIDYSLNLSQKNAKADNFGMLVVILSMLEENVEFARLLVNNNVDPDFPQKLINSPQIQNLIAQQLQTKYSEEQIDYIVIFITQGGYHMIQKWINKNHREPAKEMAKLINEFYTNFLNRL